ncbi:MAG: TauD/TfdA family dioxygenase [Woeseiaceae bacterium]
MRIQAIRQEQERLFIEWENGDQADFSFFWLRDHCQHPESLNPETLQRTVETFALPSVPPVSDVRLIDDNRSLQIDWRNENFLSEYTSEFLHQFGVPVKLEPVYSLWNNALQDTIPDFQFTEVVEDDDALQAMLEAFLSYGLVTFSGMDSNLEATRTLLERVGYIRQSIFGGLWDFSNNQKHSDSAYTSVGIGLHTDSTYCIDPPGMQLLHCLAFDGEGAYNQFADGFHAADAVQRSKRFSIGLTGGSTNSSTIRKTRCAFNCARVVRSGSTTGGPCMPEPPSPGSVIWRAATRTVRTISAS